MAMIEHIVHKDLGTELSKKAEVLGIRRSLTNTSTRMQISRVYDDSYKNCASTKGYLVEILNGMASTSYYWFKDFNDANECYLRDC